MRSLMVVVVSILFSGCATNGYRAFYTESPGADQALARRAAPAAARPKVDRLNDVSADDVAAIWRAGYVIVGESSFNSGGNDSDAGAIAQAIAVGADRVIIMAPRYTDTRSGNIPLTLPTTQTSYTTGSATAYGSGGTVTAYGNSTTTTHGTQTTFIPYSINRHDYHAVYLVKIKFILGAYFDRLSDQERAALGTNKGVRISLVVDDTPAYEADILAGDIVIAINGQSVSGPESLSDKLKELAGTTVDFALSRGGSSLSKRVALNLF